MTQTQDEQNAQNPVVQPAEPVAAEPVAAEPVAAEPVATEPVAQEAQQPSESVNVGSLLQDGTSTVTNIAST